METLERVEQLKAELDSLRPLDSEAEARIMQKFRLDWNYHSNNLEGNSLTYGETKALILFGITAQGKPLKDHFEITGHNEAINWVLDLVKGDTELTEVFIRELHTLLLKESSYKEALTPEGKPTRRKIEVGKYKTQPNHVITVTGETFYFASPEETPAKMQELIEWFRNEKAKPDVNPVILATLFHYKFIRIHPFDDGNGRVARILMNFILMNFGFPLVIIKTEDKENYYAVLTLADSDQMKPFIEYIAINLERSLEIMIRGAKGEDIEEPEDLDKELFILEMKVRGTGRKIEIPRSKEVVFKIFDESITPLIHKFIETCKKFDRFYVENNFTLFLDGGGVNKSKEDAIEAAKTRMEQNHWGAGAMNLSYNYNAFNQEGMDEVRYESRVSVKFETTKYRVLSDDENRSQDTKNQIIIEKLYSENLTKKEIEAITKLKAKEHKDYIEQKYEDWELRA